ncbi:Translocation protein S66 [Diatrype stigma]|uniref:Translocation protein S66 n=1 Tax=Diatrype stigma TaxID=117547 RepID=A0AAN9V951_9PEZI
MHANALAPGWGQTIFQSANEINANTVLRRRLEEIEAKTDAEVEWWEKRRAAIQQDFMKELDNEAGSVAGSVRGPGSVAGSVKGGSDEDGVLVDSGSTTTAPNTPGSAKKKKGGKK